MIVTTLANLNGQNTGNILQNAANLLQNTVAEWNDLWDVVFQPTGQLWFSICEFSLIIAGLSMIYTSIKALPGILNDGQWSQLAGLFVTPAMIVIFLSNGGALGAGSVRLVRGIGYGQISSMVQQQVAGQTFQVALQTMQQNAAGSNILHQIYSSCTALPPAQQQDCKNDPAKAQQAQQAMAQLGITSPPNIGNIVTDPLGAITGILMVILYGVQWAFVNCVEAALVMTGLLFPIAFALSILPIEPKPLYAWFVSIFALFSIELCYNIVTGLVATVSLNAATAGGPIQSGQDVAFAIFLSVFSPVLSVALGSGGGIAIFQQGQSAIRGAIAGGTSVVNTGLRSITAWKAATASAGAASTAQVQANNSAQVAPVNPPAAASNNNLRALPQAKG